MYLKQEDDEMKKVGFTIEFGKMEDEKERGENFVSGIEALARMTEKRLSDAVNDAELEFDAYVDALDEISSYTGEGDYETAVELIYLLALLLDEDAKEMLEGVIYPDEDAAKIFLDYFNEYMDMWWTGCCRKAGQMKGQGRGRRISLTVLTMSTAASGL